jgi:hypothetical protein
LAFLRPKIYLVPSGNWILYNADTFISLKEDKYSFMHKTITVLMCICLFWRCKREVEVEIPHLPLLIQSFTKHLDGSKDFKDAIVVNLAKENDVWEIELINTFPDSTSQVNRDTMMQGVRVFFTGEKIMNYSKKNFSGNIPLDVLEAGRKRLFWGQESTYWLLKFDKGKFIYFDPSVTICEAVPEVCNTQR